MTLSHPPPRLSVSMALLSACIFIFASLFCAVESRADEGDSAQAGAAIDISKARVKPTVKSAATSGLKQNATSAAAQAKAQLQYAQGNFGASAEGAGHGSSQSRWAIALFWLLALATMSGAIFVITRRNLVAAVIGMVGTFFGIAGLFLMLYAGFLAAIQVLVYAGAIMVLFVFVIMILNREENEPWALQGLLGKGVAAVGLVYLFARLSKVLWGVTVLKAHLPAPAPVIKQIGRDWVQYDFGSVKGVGHTLFTQYLFPFEAVSLVLLVAVVGAIAVARPHQDEPKNRKEMSV